MRLLKYRFPALILCAATAQLAWPQADFHKIKTEFQSISAEIDKHTEYDLLTGDDPAWIPLIEKQSQLSAEWVAAWLNGHDPARVKDVETAISQLTGDAGQAIALDSTSFLVNAPSRYGNVFIVSKSGSAHYRVAWSSSWPQEPIASKDPAQDNLIAAWVPKLKVGGDDSWVSAGPLVPNFEKLNDNGVFVIHAAYQQMAGLSFASQVSFWRWDGSTAHPLLAETYDSYIEQEVGTRIERGLLRVRAKQQFRNFSDCGPCKGRQVDVDFRVSADGIEKSGETVIVPELDVIDEFFARLRHDKDASDIASTAAIDEGEDLIPDDDDDPLGLGMLVDWNIAKEGVKKIVCLSVPETGFILATLKPGKTGDFIESIHTTDKPCKPEEKPQIPAYHE